MVTHGEWLIKETKSSYERDFSDVKGALIQSHFTFRTLDMNFTMVPLYLLVPTQ